MAFYENFVDLCNSIHKSPTATVIAMGFNRSTLTHRNHFIHLFLSDFCR